MSIPQSTYRLPDSLAADIEKLGELIEQVKSGALTPERFRAVRVPMGVYEQRESGTFMLRVRLPAGGLPPDPMRALADVATRFGNGLLHVTTRQDIQVHRVGLDAIHPALVALREAGLATKGGGGNTVRNITACPRSGVCANEAFDVAPYAVALTEFLLPDPLSFQLPRKYKIAFSGCSRDCAGATVADLGFIARRRDGGPGFAVYVGGGMGASSRVADRLDGFVPAAEVHLVAEAVKRVFDRQGNRRDKHKARLRFLIEQIGLDAFSERYRAEFGALRATLPPCLEARPMPPPDHPSRAPAGAPPAPGFDRWRQTNVAPQKQPGTFAVTIPLRLGDVAADTLRALADVAEAHGEGLLRTTQAQNALLRWATEAELPQLHAKLAWLGLADARPPVLRDLVACTGAATCRLGICLSRGLAKAIADELSRDGLDLDRLGNLHLHISGCPNACGRHPIAPIGFTGAARWVGGRLIPHYVVQLGGHVEEGKTRLAEALDVLPARRVPEFLREFLDAFSRSAQCPDFEAFLAEGGRALAEQLAARHKEIPRSDPDATANFDWGAVEPFSLAGRGPGECSSGVFDLIAVDLASAEQAVREGRLHAATALAARALLVTRGEEPPDDFEALYLFRKHFLDPGHVDAQFAPLLAAALRTAGAPEPERAFSADAAQVASLVRAVRSLHEAMDDSLRLPAGPPAGTAEHASRGTPDATAEVTEDLRGVACPLNYVKTKLALEEMQDGQRLEVLVGEEGARNVPASVTSNGHQVLAIEREGEHWRILIQRAGGSHP